MIDSLPIRNLKWQSNRTVLLWPLGVYAPFLGVLLAVVGTLKTWLRLKILCGTERVYYMKVKFFAVSRSRAAQQRTDKRLGGAQRLSDVARTLRAAQGSHACVTK